MSTMPRSALWPTGGQACVRVSWPPESWLTLPSTLLVLGLAVDGRRGDSPQGKPGAIAHDPDADTGRWTRGGDLLEPAGVHAALATLIAPAAATQHRPADRS